MKNLMKLALLVVMTGGFASCTVSTYSSGYAYNCYPVYDYWGWYLYDECYWEYYNADGQAVKEFDDQVDLMASVAAREELKLKKLTDHYAQKFNLLSANAEKIARNVVELEALGDRSEEDLADFAQKLYGVNPSELVSAVSNAQVGDNSGLNKLIEEAAGNFETSPETMRDIVKTLHGEALNESGIDL